MRKIAIILSIAALISCDPTALPVPKKYTCLYQVYPDGSERWLACTSGYFKVAFIEESYDIKCRTQRVDDCNECRKHTRR